MKTVSYKVWDDAEKVMRDVDCIVFLKNGTHRIMSGDEILNTEGDKYGKDILIQSTGKLGFNDREFFEGDIVFYEESEPDGDRRYYLVILWIEEWSMFASVFIDEYLKYLDKGSEALDETMFWTYTLQESEHFHYAGNIYQNADLLEKHG